MAKKKEPKDIFEKAFGKAPKKGYKFRHVATTLIDNDCFKGFVIQWSAQGVGFGELTFTWGLDMERLKDYPKQQGFHCDSECMSDEFIHALMKKAAPQIAEILIKYEVNRVKNEVQAR